MERGRRRVPAGVARAIVSCLTGLFLAPAAAFAQGLDLEEKPEPDLAQVDRSAESISVKDIKVITFRAAEGQPVLDGVIDDAFWSQAERLEITRELYPQRFAQAIVATEVLAAVTATHLYVAFVAHDPHPEQMRSYRRIRDGVKDDDYVSVVVDATGNLRRKFEFRVNPDGALTDVLQDQVSDRYIYDWDTRWDGAARITDTGYVVEIGIPLESVRQPLLEPGDTAKWLVMFKRAYPRAVDRTFGAVCIFQPEAGRPERSRTARLNVRGYYIFHPDEERDPDERFSQVKDHGNHDVGADLRLIVDSSTTIAATINPNYTEVESDIARESINNPFVPFQPEKRDFFQEGRDLYHTYMPVVYTRNIDKPELGLGFSRTGRKASSGAFWVSDESTNLIMPDNLGSKKVEVDTSSQSMGARYITGWKGSALGVLGTARIGTGYSNYVGGIDGLVNLGLDDKLRFQVMYSRTSYPESFVDDLCEGDDCTGGRPPGPCAIGDCDYSPYVLRADPDVVLKGHAIRLGYKHDGPESLYWLSYLDYSPGFRADLGFEKRVDFRQVTAAYGHNWYVQPFARDEGKSRLRAYVVANHMESQAGESIEDGFDLWGEYRGSYQSVLRGGYRVKKRAVNRLDQADLSLGDNAPRFDESYAQWYGEVSPTNFVTVNFDGRYGNIADPDNIVLGDMLELEPGITLHAPRWKLRLAHTYRDFQTDGATLWTENFTTLQAVYHPVRGHMFRLLLLNDRTTRDSARFLEDEQSFEKERSVEFTYIYAQQTGLSVLAGGKLSLESNSEINGEFTSNRQIYIKLRYDFETRFPLPGG